MKTTISSVNNFWIGRKALTLSLNALGNPNYVQASVTAGAVIMVYVEGVISFDAAHNYQRWPLVAYPTVFENDSEKFVYARIPNNDRIPDMTAMVVYSSESLDLYGEKYPKEDTGGGAVDVPSETLAEVPEEGKDPEPVVTDYYFIYLGRISSVSGGERKWLEDLTDKGKLSTDQYIQEEGLGKWEKMFSLDEVKNEIIAKLPFVSAIFRKLKIGIKEKEIVDVKRSVDTDDIVPLSDNNVPTSLYVSSNFLSKKKDDTAKGKISLETGADFGHFSPGLAGSGGHIDGNGHGEMRSLRLWETLEVPELRYNRVSVYVGIRMDTYGGGIIESVTKDAVLENKGLAILKLEDGEFGAVEEGDLMMGIWHDVMGGNALETADDHLGNFSFAGFKTVYMQVTAVSGSRNERIEYVLRSRDAGGNGVHPFPSMHIAGRGNIIEGKTQRQAFVYSTTEYSVALKGVTTWDFLPQHYYEIRGNLEGFKMPAIDIEGKSYMKEFHGYGQVFGNAYMFGDIDKFHRQGFDCEIIQSTKGLMTPADVDVVSVIVRDAYGEDVTERFFIRELTRNTGDEPSDADWNNEFKRRYPDGITNPFELAWTDMNFDLNNPDRIIATFYLTAQERETGTLTDTFFDFNI